MNEEIDALFERVVNMLPMSAVITVPTSLLYDVLFDLHEHHVKNERWVDIADLSTTYAGEGRVVYGHHIWHVLKTDHEAGKMLLRPQTNEEQLREDISRARQLMANLIILIRVGLDIGPGDDAGLDAAVEYVYGTDPPFSWNTGVQ